MIIKKELIKRQIAGETILVPVGKTIFDSNGLFIWDLLPEVETEEEICSAILEQYEVSAEEAAKDIADFLQQLKKKNII